ncbi:MAG TPA: hypothetical protein DCQ30_01925 [Acidimicrobiaceae bacterium]|nr:hypothetical protein [Acidimicrobiaceae bacterium]
MARGLAPPPGRRPAAARGGGAARGGVRARQPGRRPSREPRSRRTGLGPGAPIGVGDGGAVVELP